MPATRERRPAAPPERLEAAGTCLVLVDLLDSLVNHDPRTRKRFDPVIANVEALVLAARRADWGVVHACAPEGEVVRELGPEPGESRVAKRGWSAFHATGLDEALRARGAATLVLCGAATDVSIAATAFAARDAGYEIVVVADACLSPEPDEHAHFMQHVFPRFARVRFTAQVLDMIES